MSINFKINSITKNHVHRTSKGEKFSISKKKYLIYAKHDGVNRSSYNSLLILLFSINL